MIVILFASEERVLSLILLKTKSIQKSLPGFMFQIGIYLGVIKVILHRFDFWNLSEPKNRRISLETRKLADFLYGSDFVPKTSYPQWRLVQLTPRGLTQKGSNVIAQAFKPGFKEPSFDQRWLENVNRKQKEFASKMKCKTRL